MGNNNACLTMYGLIQHIQYKYGKGNNNACLTIYGFIQHKQYKYATENKLQMTTALLE